MASEGHVPPKAVQNAAKKALAWREDGTVDWGTDAGHKRAKQLADGKKLDDHDVKDMHGYFARHAKNPGETDADGWGDEKNPSKGYAAWLGWGGDAGKKWVDGIVEKLD